MAHLLADSDTHSLTLTHTHTHSLCYDAFHQDSQVLDQTKKPTKCVRTRVAIETDMVEFTNSHTHAAILLKDTSTTQ